MSSHHLGEAVAAQTLFGRVGRQQLLAALPPGPPGREQLREGGTQGRRLRRRDAQIEGAGGLTKAHEDLEQLRRPEGLTALRQQRQGRGLQRREQLRLVRQPLRETRIQTVWPRLAGQQLVEPPQGHEQLRPRRGQLAVAQVGELRVVHPAQLQPLRQGRQHPLAPAVALMPHLDQMPERIATRFEFIPIIQAIRIRTATILSDSLGAGP